MDGFDGGTGRINKESAASGNIPDREHVVLKLVNDLLRANGTEIVGGLTIEELGLSIKSYYCLHHHGISTAKEVADMTRDELLAVPHMREEYVREIEKVLNEKGFQLKNNQ